MTFNDKKEAYEELMKVCHLCFLFSLSLLPECGPGEDIIRTTLGGGGRGGEGEGEGEV